MNIPSNTTQSMTPLTITEAAAVHVEKMLARAPGAIGLRVQIDNGGCNGFKFHFEPTAAFTAEDHEFHVTDSLSVFVNKKMYIFIEGSQIDFEPSPLSKDMGKMLLNNPQQKGSCGCGESFNV